MASHVRPGACHFTLPPVPRPFPLFCNLSRNFIVSTERLPHSPARQATHRSPP
ncbi:hypothetical protein CABS01_01248 [Colletotrichum abscissum]|uniref:Uncharacterized protein n=4 Tax=Colletotrichum acutatum species complex TaxID=2707335 RepID=A0A9Q0B035_9PEZI|nr:uncharacterized protein CLUP02_16532 [Colletotrichum lupini]XP_060312232.1 uncharacterized protein CCOS01_09373 [Colletotrichum costaricense]XP_060374692.1 uncharacterized protein CTAM01_14722 [Colletotrichum tamarilloi]XP_060401706.1 uncharacterized protein CABS01_01248 [Colletotrichum abscissum]KAI3536309.1 hypothetical protein CABS02_12557 [Colletotrichum abscissum]KAK1479298.1 hypothetical protein CTAM01_14722 [Colletotrichum tamarilloi]KAK1505780.1 hypothetical protein CABS01_01248 [C